MGDMTGMIDVRPFAGRVRIEAGGAPIADTRSAVLLSEAGYEPVHYIPRADIRMDLLEPGSKETLCPHKGIASYWSLRAGGKVIENIAWCYETPVSTFSAVAGHLAFYRDKLDRFAAMDA